jgi:phosphopantothenoylcysteine decarboxylase/phosphopantothenate--cysteine ligase
MLDPVRFVTNRSSGRMGYALAENAQQRGAEVTLVSGPVNISAPHGVHVVNVQSTDDLYNAMMEHAPRQDIIVQSAAPADYKAEVIAEQKMKKQGDEKLILTLVPTQDVARAAGEMKKDGQTLIGFAAETENLHANAEKKLDRKNPDIAAAVGSAKKPGQTLVCFAAETENLHANAQKKLAKKNLDLIVANDVSKPGAGFNVDTNIATLITADGMTECPLRTKKELAGDILDKVMEIRSK